MYVSFGFPLNQNMLYLKLYIRAFETLYPGFLVMQKNVQVRKLNQRFLVQICLIYSSIYFQICPV